MSLTAEIKAIADKADHLSDRLHPHWLAQAVVGFVGVLYLVDSRLASLITEQFKVSSELIRFVMPGLSFYNFVMMGYLVAGYIVSREELRKLMRAQSDVISLEIATENYSLFRYFDHVLTVQPEQSWPSAGRGFRILPITFIVLTGVGVFNFGNGMAVYFIFSLTESWLTWTRWVVAVVAAVIFMSFYINFMIAMKPVLGARFRLTWPSPVMFAFVTALLMVWDPLHTINKTP